MTQVAPLQALIGYLPQTTGNVKEMPVQTFNDQQQQAVKWQRIATEAITQAANVTRGLCVGF